MVLFISMLVYAQDLEFDDETDISKRIGEDFEEGFVLAEGTWSLYQSASISTLTINGEENILTLDGNKFENMKSQKGSGHPSQFRIDEKTGKILGADFTTNENGGTYTLGGSTFNVPPNTRVQYYDDKEKSITYSNKKLTLPEGSKITKIEEETKIYGKDIKLPNKDIISGTLSYDEKGKRFIPKGEEVIINNNKKFSKVGKDVYLYSGESFDFEKHAQENYYYEEGKEIIMNSVAWGKVEVEFLEGNEFFNIDKNQHLKIEVEAGDMIKIDQRTSETNPLIIHTAHSDSRAVSFIENGRNRFTLMKDDVNIAKIKGSSNKPVEFELKTNSVPKGHQLDVAQGKIVKLMTPNGEELIGIDEPVIPERVYLNKPYYQMEEGVYIGKDNKIYIIGKSPLSDLGHQGDEMRAQSDVYFQLKRKGISFSSGLLRSGSKKVGRNYHYLYEVRIDEKDIPSDLQGYIPKY